MEHWHICSVMCPGGMCATSLYRPLLSAETKATIKKTINFMIPLHHFLIHSVCNNFLCFEVGIRAVEVTTLKNEGVKFVHHKKWQRANGGSSQSFCHHRTNLHFLEVDLNSCEKWIMKSTLLPTVIGPI